MKRKISLTEKNKDKIAYDIFRNIEFDFGDEEEEIKKKEKFFTVLNYIVDNELSLERKSAVLLHYYCGIKQTEIANILSVNKSTVSRNLSRAKKEIREKLKYNIF